MSVSSSLPQPNYQSYVKKTSARAVQTAGQHIPRHVSLVRETSSGTLLSNFNNYSQKGATTTSVGEYLCATPPPSPVIGPSAPGSATAAQSTSSGTQPTQLSLLLAGDGWCYRGRTSASPPRPRTTLSVRHGGGRGLPWGLPRPAQLLLLAGKGHQDDRLHHP
ncbi:hypothetical protein AGDE_14817 [Angomonas deanei]|nr:hypothetical protein AGDE_14817 [Angomonas deanei]|eukprot:EPY20184.1 hypothetical protein AGDE_14817 [Angomonas deanei]